MSLADSAPLAAAPPLALDRRSTGTRVLPRYTTPVALALGITVLLLLKGNALLGDPDTQWHIAVGRWIASNGTVPTTDLFSYTFAGSPWIAKEWVSQLILFVAFAASGWSGVVALTALVVAASFTGLYAWLERRMRATAAFALTLVAFGLSEAHLLARPHVLVLPIIIAWTASLIRGLERSAPPRFATALIMVAWANMHGSFPLGLVIAVLLGCEAVFVARPGSRLTAGRRWALFIALSAGATMVSPFGWRALLVPLKMFGNGTTLSFVTEWQPLGFYALGVAATLVFIATITLLLLDARANLFRILAAGIVAYLMFRHVRFVSLFGLVSPILVARTVASRLPRAAHADPVGAFARVSVYAVIGGAIVVAVALITLSRPEPMANMTPCKAYNAALVHGVSGNVYNDYDFGGFLIANGVKTFVDGRTDQLFLGDFLPELTKAVDDEDDGAFAAILARAKASWALVRPGSSTSRHFDRMPGWARLYGDGDAVVYVRD